MLSLPDERPAPKSSGHSFNVFGPSLKFKDVQAKTPTIMICLQSPTKPILMKISADFECLPGLSSTLGSEEEGPQRPKTGDYTQAEVGGLQTAFFEALFKRRLSRTFLSAVSNNHLPM